MMMWVEAGRSFVALVLGCVLLGCGASRRVDAPAALPPVREIEQLNRAQVRFAEAHNRWRKFTVNLSPASPDYWPQIEAEWKRRELSELFRKFKAEVVR